MGKRVLVVSGLNVLLSLAALLLALSRPAKGEPGPMGPMGPKGDMGAPGACCGARCELCLKCGKYKTAHEGTCDGCRWKGEISNGDNAR